MNLGLKGKTAVISGSSRGIGKSIARTLLGEGCRVVINGRRQEAVDSAVEELGGESVSGFACDVCEPSGAGALVGAALKAWGSIDILVCNVGSGASVPPGGERQEEWLRMFRINFLSASNLVEAAREELASTKGSIVCVSSICGVGFIPGAPVTYSVAKSALNSYVRGISRPLAAQGIRINAVAPGNISFRDSVWERKVKESPEQVKDMLEREVALRRLGGAHEVAEFCAFLASPKTAFATGEIFVLDGGQVRS
jgi:3-oxoacyl-[acyl-carrier protein] reductase